MTPPSPERDGVEAAVRSCYSTWGSSYYDDYYGSGSAYPPVHRDLAVRLLGAAGAGRVLDAGCGPASMMRDLLRAGLDVEGFDLTPEMVVEAKRVVADLGRSVDTVWEGSVLDASAFSPPTGGSGPYDAALCVGVLPHVPESADETVLGNLRDAVRPGGLVIAEARNELFALFTLNRFTHQLFLERLVPVASLHEHAPDGSLTAPLAELAGMFRTDLPPVRTGVAGEPGYDEVLSRVHNPFELAALARRAGLVDVSVRYFHYHALPPMFGGAVPEAALAASLEMEDPDDWRGTFMASAFFVVGTRP